MLLLFGVDRTQRVVERESGPKTDLNLMSIVRYVINLPSLRFEPIRKIKFVPCVRILLVIWCGPLEV